MRQLVENCFGYINPQTAIIDPVSGYPFEGWNQEPDKGLYLRSFTQLTAIGSWVEVLANIAAGYGRNPYLTGPDALQSLEKAVRSLRQDQRNPEVSDRGLLVNFLSLEGGRRTGPLEETVDRQKLLDVFGADTGSALWQALRQKGWISHEKNGSVGRMNRSGPYGRAHFTGALAPFAEEKTQEALMKILDARAVLVMFGDNVNLTASLAKAIGALLHHTIRDNPLAVRLRAEMELFIQAQAEGYRHLYDEKSGAFAFGWDAGRNRFVGWDDAAGTWVTGRMDYFISEFRGPWIFSVLRYGLPREAISNAGFRIKPYRSAQGSISYGLCAWDGSAFQLLGFDVFMGELRSPGWRACLELLVDIELDYSRRLGLPGFLSEAYSGNGVEYTRFIGISDIAVTDRQLITHAPSLYSLAAGYRIAPDKIAAFLAENQAVLATLQTDHGPWEGFDTRTLTPIAYQTTTHTLCLLLAGLGSADSNMARYLDMRGLSEALNELYRPGGDVDLLAAGTAVSWAADASPVSFSRQAGALRFEADFQGVAGIAVQFSQQQAPSLSGGKLRLHYRCPAGIKHSRITFKRVNSATGALETAPIDIVLALEKTGEKKEEIEIFLPATPALQDIREVALVFGEQGRGTKAALTLSAFDFKAF